MATKKKPTKKTTTLAEKVEDLYSVTNLLNYLCDYGYLTDDLEPNNCTYKDMIEELESDGFEGNTEKDIKEMIKIIKELKYLNY